MPSVTGSSSESPSRIVAEIGTAATAEAIRNILSQSSGGQDGGNTYTVTTAQPGATLPSGATVVKYETTGAGGNITGAENARVIDVTGTGTVTGTFTTEQPHVVILDQGKASLTFTGGPVTVQGGAGDLNLNALGSSVQSIIGGSGALNVLTGSGSDQIRLGSGRATIDAGAGNDEIYLGSGSATIDGGSGNNTVHAAASRGSYNVVLDASGNIVLNDGSGHISTLSNVDVVTFADGSSYVKAATADQAAVARMYEAVFDRSADADGIHYWFDALKSGSTVQQIGASFLSTAEARNNSALSGSNSDFVKELYDNLFGHQPDAAGLKFWTDALAGAVPRSEVLYSLTRSAEGVAATEGLVSLGASAQGATAAPMTFDLSGPSTVKGGDNFDVVNIAGSKSDFSISVSGDKIVYTNVNTGESSITQATEFTKFSDGSVLISTASADDAVIARMYQAVFNRDADQGGLQYWWNAHDANHVSLDDIAHSFLQSPEGQADLGSLNNGQFVDHLYQNLLGRAADQSGHDFWTGSLNTGSVSREDLIVQLSKSAEGVNHESSTIKIIDGTTH